MSENTTISWADATFNGWWGCTQISPACDNCYAKTMAARFGYGWNGEPMRLFGEAHWNEPLRWARTLPAKLGRRPRVFCASMADWLDLDAPISEFVRLLELIRTTPELDWLLLSKRIGNWQKRLAAAIEHIDSGLDSEAVRFGYPVRRMWLQQWLTGTAPANVWIGATVVNQEEADRDVPKLLQVPARVRFLSIEPMLGPVELVLKGDPFNRRGQLDPLRGEKTTYIGAAEDGRAMWAGAPCERIHWIVAGGESSLHARPAHPDWFRSLRDQCAAAGVPFHFKQWGEWMPRLLSDGHIRLGTRATGRLLDGVEHNGFPA